MESILGALKDLGLNEGGEGDGEGEQELASLLEHMMDSMMSKDVLHEPLRELVDKVSSSESWIMGHSRFSCSKFPPYLANPPEPISADDRKRYEAQLGCARKIVEVYEDPKYDEKNQESAAKVVDLMSEVGHRCALILTCHLHRCRCNLMGHRQRRSWVQCQQDLTTRAVRLCDCQCIGYNTTWDFVD